MHGGWARQPPDREGAGTPATGITKGADNVRSLRYSRAWARRALYWAGYIIRSMIFCACSCSNPSFRVASGPPVFNIGSTSSKEGRSDSKNNPV